VDPDRRGLAWLGDDPLVGGQRGADQLQLGAGLGQGDEPGQRGQVALQQRLLVVVPPLLGALLGLGNAEQRAVSALALAGLRRAVRLVGGAAAVSSSATASVANAVNRLVIPSSASSERTP